MRPGRDDNQTMLRAFVPGPGDTLAAVDAATVDLSEHAWVWFDVVAGTIDEIKALGELFHLNRHVVEDASTDTHFPKLDDYDDHLFVVLHGVAERDGRLETVELDAVVGDGFLITAHRRAAPSIDWIVEHAGSRVSGPDVAFSRLAEAMARSLLPLVEALDETIDDLEERAIVGDGAVVPEIQALRRDTIRLRRVIGPQREVLARLAASSSPLVQPRSRQRFASANDHYVRVYESVDAARTLLTSTLDTYRGAVAERMNEVMKVLTVYAAILLPLSLIAGIYGMNFANMPELQWRWGYFALLGAMGVLAVGQWIYFARRGFVGQYRFRKIPRTVGRGLAKLMLKPIDLVASAVGERERTDDSG
jgi:magnesium transporter